MKDHKPRRKAWRLGACLLANLLSLSLYLPFTAKQAKAAGRTYTVRLFTGKKGSFSGEDRNEVKVLFSEYKGSLDLAPYIKKINVTDSKYYVKGYRESGKDNNTVFPSDYKPTITRDIDYVVAYGIAGSDVEYYVNYVDENGRKLRDSKTYTGNVGDKPVVAYEYIENYFPQARNLTKTLSEKASDNNFTFVYRRVASTETATTEEDNDTDETEDNETTVTNNNDDDDNDTTTTGGNNTTGGGTTDGGGTTGDDDTEPTARTAAPAADTGVADLQDMPDNPDEVPELVDIDDAETPLADFEGSTSDEPEETTESEKPKSGLTTPAKIGIGIACAAAVIAAAGALYYFIIYRGYEYEDEDDEDEDEEGGEGDDGKE